MRYLFIFSMILLSSRSIWAQQFISRGKIEFERKVNVHKQFEVSGDWMEELKKNIPQYRTNYFNLFFDSTQSLYKEGRESTESRSAFFSDGPAVSNVVYKNYTTQRAISQKQVFEDLYLVEDSLRKIDWKLTSDVRTIAGFNCRKATGIIMDSVFIFAFYTDEILLPGGPEGFNGLPGMILGIAIPRIATTWFATKLELADISSKDLLPPTKGKKTTNRELELSLQKNLKQWGKWANRNIWQAML